MNTTRDIKRCTRCILPESLPSVELDEDGVCTHCRTYDKLVGDWEKVKSQRKREFEDLLQQVKQLDRLYDCLVALSGGKDSTYALYLLNKVYGLKCLCVTFDNGYLSDHARANIKNATEAAGADHIYYSIGRDTLLRLYRLFLAKCGNFCPACHRGAEASVEIVLRAFKIPLAVGGHGRRISYLSIVPEVFQGGDVHFFRNAVKGDPLEKEVGLLWHTFPSYREAVISKLRRFRVARVGFRLLGFPRSFVPLVTPVIGLFDWIDVPYDEVYSTLEREMGWTKPSGHPEHMDCLVHEIPPYIHTLKFPELTTGTIYRSGMVRLGEMTRAEAMKVENEELASPKETPHLLDAFLTEIGMSKDELEASVQDWRTIEQFRKKR